MPRFHRGGFEGAVEHRLMLARDADKGAGAIRIMELTYERHHLDRIEARTEDRQETHSLLTPQ